MGIEFTRPIALSLLLLLVAIIAIDRQSRRAQRTARRYALLAVRLLTFTLLVLALAAPVIWTGTDTLSTVFLVDRSASVPASEQQKAIDWIESAIQQKHPTDRAAVISFAGNAAVEQGLSAAPSTIVPTAHLDGNHTDIASALHLAEGVLPLGGSRRIVLLSDGNQNLGNALDEAPLLRANGIPVDTVPIATASGPEVAVRRVNVPPAIHKGERFTVNVTISSTVETTARVRFLVDQRLDSTQTFDLHVGDNSLVFAHEPLTPGEHTLGVIVEPERDTLAENNVGYATLQVSGPPRVLLVEGDPGDAKYLSKALDAAGLSVDVEAPSILGGDVASLRQYDAIGLVNVPATRIGSDGLIALRSYVQDFGGGLVVVGGDRSFGVGAYRKTPLEEALPVSMDVRGRQAHANVALILVIDTSGSMSEGPQGATKIELAREAALGATKELVDQDQIGIVAFDEQPHWIFPTQYLTDRTALETAISRLQPGGGTEIYPALKLAYDDIVNRPAKVKHILLMTDGLAPMGDYAGLTAQMRAHGVTLSTIGIGTDADLNLLQNLADWGRGRFYDASNPLDVPRFVLKETTEIARAAVTEETFTPTTVDQTSILNGITKIPPLYGYVATTPKPSAVVGLESPEHDPILAQWHFGLGRSVAFTSDATARWSSAWVSWSGFSQFWGQVFKWVVPAPQGESLQVQTTTSDGLARIVVDATDGNGHYINDAQTTATIGSPKGEVKTVALDQVAPGRYAAQVPADEQGAYLVQVSQAATGQATPVAQTSGFTVPYSPEFGGQPTDVGLLRQLAASTGGAVLTSPADSFAHNLRPADSAQPIWPYLIAAVVPLFLLDVAIRRLRFSPADFSPVIDRVRVRWLGRAGSAAHLASRLATARRAPRPTPTTALRRPAPVPRHSPTPAHRISTVGASPGAPPANRLLAAKRRVAPTPHTARR
jgi:Mg-chelatase subunit ChlD